MSNIRPQKTDTEKQIRDLFTQLYANMKSRNKIKNHGDLPFNKDEFIQWFQNQKNYQELKNNWAHSGYDKWLKPTVNRINDDMGYCYLNMELLSWRDNKDVQTAKQSTPVTQWQDDVMIARWDSIKACSRGTGITEGRIRTSLHRASLVDNYAFKR